VRVPERYDTRLDRDVQGTFTAVDGRTFALTLGARAPAIDPRTRTRDTWFLADGAAPLGASGRALVTAASWDGVTIIPEPGLTRVDGEPVVMRRVGEAARAEVTPVQVVGRAPDVVYVTGLDTGDEVAVRGVFLLKSLALLEGAGESE